MIRVWGTKNNNMYRFKKANTQATQNDGQPDQISEKNKNWTERTSTYIPSVQSIIMYLIKSHDLKARNLKLPRSQNPFQIILNLNAMPMHVLPPPSF